MTHWYDPEKNFTSPGTFAGSAEALKNQLDPQSMADIIVDVILSDNPKFRNIHPKETEDFIKELEKNAWTTMS
jgi:hypothetical protein